ncbi:hypothetical protein KSP40_PGU020032 [Platanthera guangdongensis]|uniref:Uncharacterized protein n=1 Tax=Platanthera guangdongensis TaxID=2320717 RepID=A0ABR2MZ71_9ASPA
MISHGTSDRGKEQLRGGSPTFRRTWMRNWLILSSSTRFLVAWCITFLILGVITATKFELRFIYDDFSNTNNNLCAKQNLSLIIFGIVMGKTKPSVSKKPKKGVDFKKIKPKIGRKLPPPKNFTNTIIKSKALRLLEQTVATEKTGRSGTLARQGRAGPEYTAGSLNDKSNDQGEGGRKEEERPAAWNRSRRADQ